MDDETQGKFCPIDKSEIHSRRPEDAVNIIIRRGLVIGIDRDGNSFILDENALED